MIKYHYKLNQIIYANKTLINVRAKIYLWIYLFKIVIYLKLQQYMRIALYKSIKNKSIKN